MSYYQLCRKDSKSSCTYIVIGIIYGDSNVIYSYYSKKNIKINLIHIDLIDKEGNKLGKGESAPYSKTIWNLNTSVSGNMYVLGDTEQEAKKYCQLYSFKNAIPSNNYPLDSINVTKCELLNGIPEISV